MGRWGKQSFVWLAAVLAASACTPPRASSGGRCLFNADCADPLVCTGYRCRRPCRSDADCTSLERCRDAVSTEGPAVRVCLPAQGPQSCATDLDCAAPLRCGADHSCRAPCLVDADCRFVAPGATCALQAELAGGVCVSPDGGASTDAPPADAPPPLDASAPDAAPELAPEAGDAALEATLDAPLGRDSGPEAASRDVPSIEVLPGSADALALDVPSEYALDFGPQVQAAWVGRWYDASAGVAFHSACALLSNGETWCWGNTFDSTSFASTSGAALTSATQVYFPVRSGFVGVQELALTEGAVCARIAGGLVQCAGRNASGQLGNGSTTHALVPTAATGVSGVVGLAAGARHVCALEGGSTVLCWGANNAGQTGATATGTPQTTPARVAGLTAVAQLAGLEQSTCARMNDGTVRCWGANNLGQLGDGTSTASAAPRAVLTATSPATPLDRVTALTARADTACAVRDDGSLWCWGRASQGQFGAVIPGGAARVATRVTALGEPVLSVGTGDTTCAVVGGAPASRNVRCVGDNTFGQLGRRGLPDGATGGTSLLGQPVYGLFDGAWALSGSELQCARDTQGRLACWGSCGLGACGNVPSPSVAGMLYPFSTSAPAYVRFAP